ncbi:glycosyltransferase [Nostoc sp. CHAB 5836]|nr:glycosyltransferase [Nostoc sp. CHAB 5836]
MKIWFLTTVLPHSLTSGGEIASQSFIDALRALGHDVTVFGYVRDDISQSVPVGSIAVSKRPIETAAARLAPYLWIAKAVIANRPYICEKFYSSAYRRALRKAHSECKPDHIIIDHSQMGWILQYLADYDVGRIFIAHNVEASLYDEQAKNVAENSLLVRTLLARDSQLIGKIEKRLAEQCDQIWTLTDSERKVFNIEAGREKSRLMQLAGRPVTFPEADVPIEVDIGLLGTWAWDVNGRGLTWFTSEIAPKIPTNFAIRVGGRGSETVNGIHPNLTGVGFVDDPAYFMHASKVLAIPTVSGAGVQLKTIEAIAAGVRVVSTTLGVRGLGKLPPYVTVADTPTDFANALVAAVMHPDKPDRALAIEWADNRRAMFLTNIMEAAKALSATQQNEQAGF